ncbi:MAG: threonine/serine dehydratase [Woeseiaceae bacterium]|nr:threonine/serine dehydratase [Woeseiaceae bacterium]
MISIKDIESAATRLKGVAIHTPLVENAALNELAGGRVMIKPECLQRTGSFKIRGAYNMMSRIEDRDAGVVAFSSGNHAQGVAAAGQLLGIETTIVMPSDAPRAKLDNTRKLGGKVVTYDRYTEDREAIARAIADERGSVVIPPFDHEQIIAGQGTVGLELADDLQAESIAPDQLFVCCGGGGLTSGTGLALRDRFPEAAVFTVEPEFFDDTARSLQTGTRQTIDESARSICDSILAPSPGEMTFALLKAMNAQGLVVNEDEVREAMRFAFRELKLVVEPGGAVALAAAMFRKAPAVDAVTVIVISGGNVDVEIFADVQTAAT